MNYEGKEAQQEGLKAVFLDKPGILAEALKRQEDLNRPVPDFEKPSLSGSRAISSLEIALIKLQAERELTGELWADDFGELNPETEFDLDFSPLTLDEIRESFREEKIKSIISRHPCLADLPKGVQVPSEIVLPPRKAST